MLYIARHGQTEQNKKQLLQGRSNFPLDETGIRQAARLGAWFADRGIAFDAVYASPLGRAIETARLAAGQAARIQVDDRLLEMDYGPYEGMDLTRPAPEVLAFFRDFLGTPAPKGMEPLADVVARMGAFLRDHWPEAAQGNVLISTHAIAMKGALEYLTPQSRGSYWAKYIGNCAVYTATCQNGLYSVPVELITA